MTELFIVLGLSACVVWIISRTVLLLVRMDTLNDVPTAHFDPISSYVSDNYGQHFQDENKVAEECWRKL